MELTDEQEKLYTEICNLIEEKLGRRTATLSNSLFAMVWNKEQAWKEETLRIMAINQHLEIDLAEMKCQFDQTIEGLKGIQKYAKERASCSIYLDAIAEQTADFLSSLSQEGGKP